MIILLESLLGLILAGTFGSRLLFGGGALDRFFTSIVRKPLMSLSERIGRMLNDKILSWAAFILGIWIAIPLAIGMDKWPAVALILAFLVAYARAGNVPLIGNTIDGEATEVTPVADPTATKKQKVA